jgi:hypothetical protein
MSDVDGEVEISGHWLRLEWKSSGAPLPKGQEINYKRLTASTATVVFIVFGDANAMDITEFDIFWKGNLIKRAGTSIEELKARFVTWAIWAEGPFK